MGSERGVCWGVSGDPHSPGVEGKDVRVCLRKRGVSARGGGACATTMKLDPSALRYLSKDDFRVLTAVELGQRNVRASNVTKGEREGKKKERNENGWMGRD